jgi:acyl-CoA synthetase (NDP forming)
MRERSAQQLQQQLARIFYPRSIAVVGVSQNPLKIGSMWLKALMDAGFSGQIYPVNPRGGEIFGLRILRNLVEIPGPVDYVIVTIPRENVPGLLNDCVAKGVKAIHFFTAGFGELGDESARKLEGILLEKAQQGGFRIIGPNCIGIYSAEAKIPYGPAGKIGKSGSVGFISQSGGVGEKLTELGFARGIHYNKGVSFGNGIDLDSADFLEYMGADPSISVVGMYLEGTRHGRRLFETMRAVAPVKPIVACKAGRTDVGANTAKSHTGSLSSSPAIWSAMLKQCGVVEVYDVDEMADSLLIFQHLSGWSGKNVAIVGGLIDGGGGISVTAADTCAAKGLDVPPLSADARQKLSQLLGHVGSILHNPIDVSQANGNPATIREALETIMNDMSIDMMIVQEDIGILHKYLPKAMVHEISELFIELKAKYTKPIVMVLPPGLAEEERVRTEKKFSEASIPVFPSMERAAKAIANLKFYSDFRRGFHN